ncbi:MAG TPA: type II toxin-antitoxin system VapC family toxin [Candidatus Limnocylindrales bacterium]|jgi:indolepyruvate ferredoxin oxidoreductase alpha subunit
MTRYVIDAGVAIRIASGEITVAPQHELLAPTLLRSQVLSALHEAVARGDMSEAAALDCLKRLHRLSIRLLGDGVLRRTAWDIANELASGSTYEGEYLALTRLQADAFVTGDDDLAKRASALVPIADVTSLTQ